MQAFEEESKRVLKKQRLCVAQIEAQLDFLLEEVAITKQQLVEQQDEYRRKKSRSGHAHDAFDSPAVARGADAMESASEVVDARSGSNSVNSSEENTGAGTSRTIDSEMEEEEKQESEDDAKDSLLLGLARAAREKEKEDEGEPAYAEHSDELEKDLCAEHASVVVEEEESEIDNVLQGFIHRVRLLNVEKNVADELKSIHVALSKYAKQIDKVTC